MLLALRQFARSSGPHLFTTSFAIRKAVSCAARPRSAPTTSILPRCASSATSSSRRTYTSSSTTALATEVQHTQLPHHSRMAEPMLAAASPSFYKRPLPPSCIPFSGAEGKHFFAQAMAEGNTESYFTLAGECCTSNGRRIRARFGEGLGARGRGNEQRWGAR